jgi:hypothetical protein
MRRSSLAILSAAVLCACTSNKKAPPTKIVCEAPAPTADLLGGKDCDSLVPTQCGYPFPSNVYLVDDPKMVTGKHVEFRATTLPYLITSDSHTDPTPWKRSDGFSPGQAPLAHLPGATVTGLPTQYTLDASVKADSPTILLEVNCDGTWRFIPHFAELDKSTQAPNEEQTFMIRPMERLKDSTRYIVAIRHVVDANGKRLEPSATFKALRDGGKGDASVEARRALYENIFDNLYLAGIPREDLQLAWDYTTASRENNTRDMIAMRDDALRVVGEQGPEYSVTQVIEDPNEYIARRIIGKMKVPLYMQKAEPGTRMNRGEDGLPKQNGFAEYPFLVQIPKSLRDDPSKAAGVLQQGHGLLGNREEAQDSVFARLANEGKYVTIAINLTGFAHEDVPVAISVTAQDIGNFLGLVDPQHQGFINQLCAMRMMIGRFKDDPNVKYNGVSTINPAKRYYRGDSQGGIMGATYMAITTDIERGYLGEPGMPYNILLNRSQDFDGYMATIRATYNHPREPQMILGLMQMLWDRTEPDGYAPYIAKNMLPNTPKHSVLLHAAIGDFQVTPLGAHIMAHAIGAKSLKPAARAVYGLEEVDGPLAIGESAFQEFDYQLDQNPDMSLPDTNEPPTITGSGSVEDGQGVDCDPHDKVRQQWSTVYQEIHFFDTGELKNFCTGQSLRPANATKPGSCKFDWRIPYEPSATPKACTPG